MKNLIKSLVACSLLAGAGWAAAAEPIALTDNQMDAISAGAFISSGSGGGAFALGGLAGSGSTTSAVSTRRFSATSASTVSLAVGVVAVASSGGSSSVASYRQMAPR